MIELLSRFSSPLFGGILIGLAALLLMFSIGRIAGVSGIASGFLTNRLNGERLWRGLFLLGMLLGTLLFSRTLELSLPFRESPPIWLIAIAGLLVGFGTHWGSGCTSGHGVCGIGRFSVRSIVATVTFMCVAIVTVFIARHLIGS